MSNVLFGKDIKSTPTITPWAREPINGAIVIPKLKQKDRDNLMAIKF